MADTISISCSNCKKGYNVPGQLKGKKIRCKSCGQALTVEESKSAVDEEWGSVVNAYGVTETVEKAMCPYCAKELKDSSIVVCLHCGFNLQTRERMEQKVLEPLTGADYFKWHLPAALVSLFGILWIISIIQLWTDWPRIHEKARWVLEPEHLWARVWFSVLWFFFLFLCARFAFKRFVINPHPPERKKRERKKEDDD